MGRKSLGDYDCAGWATKYNIKCADGRTIMNRAFADDDGKIVPIVWNHKHDSVNNVLGHALLLSRPEGMRAYMKFDNSDEGRAAKQRVMDGSLNQVSIYANQLKESAGNVHHGIIRELSLVLAGANEGAVIDQILAHGADGEYTYTPDEAIIYSGEELSLSHADEDEAEDIPDERDDKKGKEDMAEENEKTVQEVFDTLNEEQKQAVYFIIGQMKEEMEHSAFDDDDDYEEDEDEEIMHSIFEGNDAAKKDALVHDALNEVMKDGKKFGSLKESYLAHAQEYGIENMDFINTEDKNISDKPDFINTNPIGWVTKVINGVHHTPFQKVRMIHADITEDEARAKGYTKGNRKKEEVFKLLKRSIGPTMIYKKQKFDREDLLDADFDVVPWVKEEMTLKLDEEKARAYLFGDGRSAADDDKVKEDCIIPMAKDDDLYCIKYTVTPGQDESLEHALIDGCVLAQDDYQGSGNITAFIEQKQVSKMLLMEDKFGHRLYKDVNDLAAAMGVSSVVKVPASIVPNTHYGLLVDLSDYNIGTKNAGKRAMFDDFDIDYNQYKYLIEDYQSGALIRPYSAIALLKPEQQPNG